jgi:hypothetical protein
MTANGIAAMLNVLSEVNTAEMVGEQIDVNETMRTNKLKQGEN